MKHSYVTDCDERYQFPAAFSYSITFSGQEEGVVFKILYESFTATYWKQWWNGNSFFCVSSKLLHFCFFLLIFSAQCLSPDCVGYFPFTFSLYLTCHPFSPCSCALIVQSPFVWLSFQSYPSFFTWTHPSFFTWNHLTLHILAGLQALSALRRKRVGSKWQVWC